MLLLNLVGNLVDCDSIAKCRSLANRHDAYAFAMKNRKNDDKPESTNQNRKPQVFSNSEFFVCCVSV